jgi:DNA gyrase subunit A
MDAFTNVPSNGKFAMRFEEDSSDHLVGVALLTQDDDVLLATRHGKAIRFESTAVREFQSRTSTGVRGITLKSGDAVISLSILKGFKASTDEREAYLKAAPWKEGEREATLSPERMAEFEAVEEFILTVCANGYGKRSSAYEYRRTNRGGQGITNIDNLERNGPVVASFPAHNGEQLMLVTDQAKMIRMSVGDTRVIGRNSAGVRLFNVAENEHVVSAARIEESGEDVEEGVEEGADEDAAAGGPLPAPDDSGLEPEA